jgi:RHS repeat-associated protein
MKFSGIFHSHPLGHGNKHYELGNHLGNVLAVVTDNIHMADDLTTATVASASDYYPFGLQMNSRTVNDGDYRYGFNGKEKDQDGEFGNTHYDYGFRIYNPAIAKFLSVDPLTKSYLMLTPYQFASNTPIAASDLDGLEARIDITFNQEDEDYLNGVRTYDEIKADRDARGRGAIMGLGILGVGYGAAYAIPFLYSEAQAIWAAPWAYFYIFLSDPSKVETTIELGADIFTKEGSPFSPTSAVTDLKISKIGDVGSYTKNLKLGKVGDKLTPDHIPSFAPVKKSLEDALGESLTPQQARELKKMTTTLVLAEQMHIDFSRTYGGRNLNLFEFDARDLREATNRDLEALRPHLLDEGFTDEAINDIFDQVHKSNEKAFEELGLDY